MHTYISAFACGIYVIQIIKQILAEHLQAVNFYYNKNIFQKLNKNKSDIFSHLSISISPQK